VRRKDRVVVEQVVELIEHLRGRARGLDVGVERITGRNRRAVRSDWWRRTRRPRQPRPQCC
jgi:hypothetical protein